MTVERKLRQKQNHDKNVQSAIPPFKRFLLKKRYSQGNVMKGIPSNRDKRRIQ